MKLTHLGLRFLYSEILEVFVSGRKLRELFMV